MKFRKTHLALCLSILVVMIFYMTSSIFEDALDYRVDGFREKIEKSAAQLNGTSSIEVEFADVEMICLQTSYLSKAGLEEVSGRRIDKFADVKMDEQFRIHFFDGEHRQLLFRDKLIRLDFPRLKKGCERTKKIRLQRQKEFVMLGFI